MAGVQHLRLHYLTRDPGLAAEPTRLDRARKVGAVGMAIDGHVGAEERRAAKTANTIAINQEPLVAPPRPRSFPAVALSLNCSPSWKARPTNTAEQLESFARTCPSRDARPQRRAYR